MRAAFAFAIAISIAMGPARASAFTKEQCIEANVNAQDARRDRHFTQASKALKICLDTSCPAALRDDCATRLDELTKAMPTLVFAAKDGEGHDLTDVKVTMDGKPLVDKLDGTAIEVDPGEHEFVFESAGKRVTKKLLISEGEKSRHESIVIGEKPAPLAAVPAAKVTPEPQPTVSSSSSTSRRTWGWVLSGVGLVGIGAGAYLGLHASSRWSDSKNACSSGACPDRPSALEAHDDAVRSATFSTLSFVVGGALVASGVVLVLTSPSSESGPKVGLVPGLGGVSAIATF